MIPYKRPIDANADLPHKGFQELGERLNVDRDALAANLDAISHRGSYNNDKRQGIELNRVEPVVEPEIEPGVEASSFASPADRYAQPRYSEFPRLPGVRQILRSPFDAGATWTGEARPTHASVSTDYTLDEE